MTSLITLWISSQSPILNLIGKVAPFPIMALTVLVISLLIASVQGCFPSGICGANPMCGGGLLPPIPPIGLAQPPCQMSGMMRGPYGCYRQRAAYGSNIYKPVKKFPNYTEWQQENDEDWDLIAASPSLANLRRSPQAPINPNKAFMSCCIGLPLVIREVIYISILDRKLPDACLQKCHYGAYKREAVRFIDLKQPSLVDHWNVPETRWMSFGGSKGNSILCGSRYEQSTLQITLTLGEDHSSCCERNDVTTTLAGRKCLTFCNQRPGYIVQLDMTYLPCFERFENMKSCFWSSFNRRIKSSHHNN
jgi:hypothetical protein